MKFLCFVLLISYVPVMFAISNTSNALHTHTETCPYANEGLTWQVIAKSDVIGIEYVRSGQTDQEWNDICVIVRDIADHLSATCVWDEENVVLVIKRAAISDKEWANVLQRSVDLCKERLNTILFQSETKMAIYLNGPEKSEL